MMSLVHFINQVRLKFLRDSTTKIEIPPFFYLPYIDEDSGDIFQTHISTLVFHTVKEFCLIPIQWKPVKPVYSHIKKRKYNISTLLVWCRPSVLKAGQCSFI